MIEAVLTAFSCHEWAMNSRVFRSVLPGTFPRPCSACGDICRRRESNDESRVSSINTFYRYHMTYINRVLQSFFYVYFYLDGIGCHYIELYCVHMLSRIQPT